MTIEMISRPGEAGGSGYNCINSPIWCVHLLILRHIYTLMFVILVSKLSSNINSILVPYRMFKNCGIDDVIVRPSYVSRALCCNEWREYKSMTQLINLLVIYSMD